MDTKEMENNNKCVRPVCPNYDANYAKSDTFADYCPKCIEENKRVAALVDKQMAGKAPKKAVKSDFQLYEELQRTTGIKFPRA